MKAIYTIITAIILVACGSDKKGTKPIIEIEINLKPVVEIDIDDDFLIEISDYIVKDDFIFILDLKQQKVLKYDLQGNLIISFGEKGLGPSEFQAPTNLVALGNAIGINDYSRKRLIKFDYHGKYLTEIPYDKDCLYSLIDVQEKNDYDGYSGYVEFYKGDNQGYRLIKGFCDFDNQLNIKKYIKTISDKPYNPYYISYLNYVHFSFNFNDDIYVNALASTREIIINVIKGEENEKVDIFYPITPVRLPEYIAKKYEEKNIETRKRYGDKVQIDETPEHYHAVSSITLDQENNIWVLSPKNEESKCIYIFNLDGKLLGNIPISKETSSIFITEDYMIATQIRDEKPSKFVLYLYKNN